MYKKIIKISTLFILISFVVSGCTFSFPWEKDRSEGAVEIKEEKEDAKDETENNDESLELDAKRELRQFKSLKAAQDFIKNNPALASSLEQLIFDVNYGATGQLAIKDLTDSSVFSKQPDSVQIADDYVYILNEEKIQVISITSLASPSIVSEKNLFFKAQEMKIFENNLLVAGVKNNRTILYIYDISNPLKLELKREVELNSDYAGMYISDKQLYFLTTNKLDYNKADNILPDIYVKGKRINSRCVLNEDCVSSQIYYFNHNYNSYGLLSVIALDVEQTSGPIKRQIYLLDDSYRLYLSKNNDIYLAKEHYLSRDYLEIMVQKELFADNLESDDTIRVAQFGDDIEKIKPIFKNYLDTLEAAEKEEAQIKINSAVKAKIKDLSYELEGISLYKFSSAEGKLKYEANGEIAGRFLKSNFIDEEAGYLRLVTGRGELWPLLFSSEPKEYSNAYVLDDKLKIVGALENIVTSNSLARAHFLSNRSYLFTTKETDPIYVIDWQQIEKPTILGALQVNGYSAFYPADLKGEKLLAFGKEKRESEADSLSAEVLKLSLFDFSDLKKPSELSSYIIGDDSSDSFALQDYKSLANIFANKIIIVPTSFQDQMVLSFSGVLVFSADASGTLNLLYRIDHSANGQIANEKITHNFSYLNNTVRRSFIEQNYLFTVSNKYLKINNLNDGTEIASLILSPSFEDDLVNANVNITEPEYEPIIPIQEESYEELIIGPEEQEADPELYIPLQDDSLLEEEMLPEAESNNTMIDEEALDVSPEEEIVSEEQVLVYDDIKCDAMCAGALELELEAYCIYEEELVSIYDFCNLDY